MATKVVYHFVDDELAIDVKSRETFKRSDLEIHYPFRPRTGRPKYTQIRKITYEAVPSPLPAGILKAPTTGYGFTRDLSPLLYELQERFPWLSHIRVTTLQPSGIEEGKQAILSLPDLHRARPLLSAVRSRHSDELSTAANNALSNLFPQFFRDKKVQHRPGHLFEYIESRSLRPSNLSEQDFEAIAGLIADLPPDHPFILHGEILETRTSIDRILVEELISEYKRLLSLKTKTKNLESKWQAFLSRNLLYFNFGYVRRFEKELILGDKSLNFPDFVVLNTLGYLDVFEIKTHLTQLLTYDKGRKNFYWTSEASKGISQAQNYLDALAKEEDRVIKNIRDEYDIHSVNAVRPTAYVLASTKTNIAGKKTTTRYKGRVLAKLWNDFRRLNDSLHNVRFILYDELLAKFESMLERIGEEIDST